MLRATEDGIVSTADAGAWLVFLLTAVNVV